MANSKSIVLGLSALVLLHNVNGLNPLVETNVGIIRGLQADNGDYSMFLGIPYAEVDYDNPFGLSTPYPVFNKTFEAYDDSARCPQYDDFTRVGAGFLDCLHLNVYVPNSANDNNLLPVMVYIHGGGFFRGYGIRFQKGPKFLIRHGVVLVTFTYRVGAYGFMCLGTPEVPGNQGLKDQVIALRWIKNNIKAFGGDPNQITILGESAGGRSVDFHIMANEEDLFHKAVMQSGNSMSPPAVGEVNTDLPLVLAKALGLETDDFRQAVSFLTRVDPKLVASTAHDVGWTFQACVENDLEGVEKFVTDFTINRDVSKVKTTPILLGFNGNEKYYAHHTNEAFYSYYKDTNIFMQFLRAYFTFDEEKLLEAEKLIRTYYIEDNLMNEDVKHEMSDFDSDFYYIHPTHRRISQYISNGANNIYLYMFTYKGGRNLFAIQNNVTLDGAIHADEMGYLFDEETLAEPNAEDQLMIDRMTTMWTNFAKYGDPTPETSALLPVKWEPVTEANWYFYNLGKQISLGHRPLNHRMTFLDLFFKMNEQYIYGIRQK